MVASLFAAATQFFGGPLINQMTSPPKVRGYPAGTRRANGWGLKISDFMPPIDRRRGGPRPGHTYRAMRRTIAKELYRRNVKRPGFRAVAAG